MRNGAANCPECGSRMAIVETNHAHGMTYRIGECACGERWELEERRASRLPPRIRVGGPVQPCTAVHSGAPPPTGVHPPPNAEGEGGGLSSGIDPVRNSGPISKLPDQTRAESKARAIDYPDAFLVVWENTGKRGGKEPALKAWIKRGRPPWALIEPVWRAYMLSERPVTGYVKDLSSWLSIGGHTQEWVPFTPKPTNGALPFAKRAEDEAKARALAARAKTAFGGR